MLTFITGGIKSGKSRCALELARREAGNQSKCFIATAEAIDEDMKRRIFRHQEERGSEWTTFETPLDLSGALLRMKPSYQFIVIDCLTLWMGNLLHYQAAKGFNLEIEIQRFEDALKKIQIPAAIVSNEVGLGIIPENPLARQYADWLGKLNQRIAKQADRVIFMVSGIPVEVKEGHYVKLEK